MRELVGNSHCRAVPKARHLSHVGATPDQVPESVLNSFGWLYVPVIFSLWMIMIASLSLYSVDRQKHEQNLATLRADED